MPTTGLSDEASIATNTASTPSAELPSDAECDSLKNGANTQPTQMTSTVTIIASENRFRASSASKTIVGSGLLALITWLMKSETRVRLRLFKPTLRAVQIAMTMSPSPYSRS